MSQDADALREVVDRKADDVKRDLEEIGERVIAAPKAAVEEKVETFRRYYGPVRRFIHDHPLVSSCVALATGYAIGFFVV